MATDDRRVEGYCPMGCGRTLFLGDGGEITCSWRLCPRRSAVAEILADKETEHIVWFGESTFTVLHPLRERLADEDAQAAIAACALHEHVKNLDGPPVAPGKYRATARTGAGWAWDVLAVTAEFVPCTCPDDCEREH